MTCPHCQPRDDWEKSNVIVNTVSERDIANALLPTDLQLTARGVGRQLQRHAAKIVGLQCSAEQLVQLTDSTPTPINMVAIGEIAESMLYQIEDARAEMQRIAEQLHDLTN